MIVICPDCGRQTWKIDIERRGKTKRIVTIFCLGDDCHYTHKYVIPKGVSIVKKGHSVPRRDKR